MKKKSCLFGQLKPESVETGVTKRLCSCLNSVEMPVLIKIICFAKL